MEEICYLNETASLLVSTLAAWLNTVNLNLRPSESIIEDIKQKEWKHYRTNSMWNWIGERFDASIRAPGPLEFEYYPI